MIRVMKLCALLTLISFSFVGCSKVQPQPPKMDTCHIPYTEPAVMDNTPCPHDAKFYTCVKIKAAKNYEAKKYENSQRVIHEGVCK